MRSIGLPPSALAFIDILYQNNTCRISHKGENYEGFGIFSGVRQGCPISPLLFAASVDVLLRRLQHKIPSSVIRAFADDIGLVAEDWDRDSSIIKQVFDEFAEMSGLDLNIPKTIVVPLWPEGEKHISGWLENSGQSWSNLKIKSHTTYLGFNIGPGKGDSSWDAPLLKFAKRVDSWSGTGAGAQLDTLAYNTFALPTLLFIAQLERPPHEALAAERAALRRMLPGPGNWCETRSDTDAFFLKECYGQVKSYGSLDIISKACKLRVTHMHNTTRRKRASASRASITKMFYTLDRDMRNCDSIAKQIWYQGWFHRSFVRTLYHNAEDLRSQNGVT